MTDYLTLTDILGIHKVLISRYGGADGVRDMGALEAAVFRPQSGYYNDIIEEAAALLESLAINHPFIDGNKRAAFGAADVFLRINGYRIDSTPQEIHQKMIALFEAGEFKLGELEPWLRSIVKEV